MSTYPRDRWATAQPVLGLKLPPGLRNRRRYALWEASQLAADPAPGIDHDWRTDGTNELLLLMRRRPAAAAFLTNFAELLDQATATPGNLWLFKGVYGIGGLHGPAFSIIAAPASPSSLIVCFDDLAHVAITYGGRYDSHDDRELIASATGWLYAAIERVLTAGDPALHVFPPAARQRRASLAAEITGQPYPYQLPEAARSTSRSEDIT